MTAPCSICKTRDLGLFRVGDKPAPEVLECFDLGHKLECREHPGYWLYFCLECGIRYRVKIEEDEA